MLADGGGGASEVWERGQLRGRGLASPWLFVIDSVMG
jgi:hypothetical protein